MVSDTYGRPIKSLRVQVNTTCNFKCFFCHMEGTGVHSESLTPDEIEKIIETAHKWGVNKIKFTGGEPTLRPDIVEIVRRTRKHITGNISMTTNGIMLSMLAGQLKEAGLDRINISFHSIDRSEFQFITGTDSMEKVRDGIRAAKNAGLFPIKLNFVVLKGINVDQIPRMIDFAAEEEVILQLIEYETTKDMINSEDFLKYHVDLKPIEDDIRKRSLSIEYNELHRRPKYLVVSGDRTAEVEFVKPMWNHEFCSNCTRMRVTSTGLLKTCLMRDDDYTNMVSGIREKKGDDYLDGLFLKSVKSREPYWKKEDAVEERAPSVREEK